MKTRLLYILVAICTFSCQPKYPQYNDPVPDHDSLTIQSKAVNETRVVNIWTPPQYTTETDSFPVLYMPDGGVKEDFPHIANTLAMLIDSGQIPPFILVGIENTERRRDLTGPSENPEDEQIAPLSDGASDFRNFIRDELFPEINKRYRTNDYKGIIGESAAGLFVIETFLLEPEMFNYYIGMDPAIYWNNNYLVNSAESHLEKFTSRPIKLWFAASSVRDIQPHNRALAEILEHNAPDNLNWKYSDKPSEKHHTIFRATKEKALIWTLNKN